MAKSKDDSKYGTAQAKLSEDEMLRVAYKGGTPIEAGKIAESEPVHLFSSAHHVAQSNQPQHPSSSTHQSQMDADGGKGSGAPDSTTT